MKYIYIIFIVIIILFALFYASYLRDLKIPSEIVLEVKSDADIMMAAVGSEPHLFEKNEIRKSFSKLNYRSVYSDKKGIYIKITKFPDKGVFIARKNISEDQFLPYTDPGYRKYYDENNKLVERVYYYKFAD